MLTSSGFISSKKFSLFTVTSILLFAVSNSYSQSVTKRLNKPRRVEKHQAVEYINPPALSKSPRFSQVVAISQGRLIYISGQTALDRDGNLIGNGNFRAQTERVFQNLQNAVEAAGGSLKDIVKLNTYLTDLSQIGVYREIRDRYIGPFSNRPASTTVQVRSLTREDAMIEVEAIAVVQDRSAQ